MRPAANLLPISDEEFIARVQQGLCITCAENPGRATEPSMIGTLKGGGQWYPPDALARRRQPRHCRQCWASGQWRAGLPGFNRQGEPGL